MIKREKRFKSRGLLTPDVDVYPELVNVARNVGWQIRKITRAHTRLHDDTIAIRYGKGQAVLLTYDKTFYKNNPDKGGFVAFIEYDALSKDVLEEYCKNFTRVLSSFTSTDIRDYRIVMNQKGSAYKKISIRRDKRI